MRNLLLFLLKKGTPLQSVELSFLLSRIAINSASTENANDTTTLFVMPEQLDICMFSCCNLQELYSNYNTSVFFYMVPGIQFFLIDVGGLYNLSH